MNTPLHQGLALPFCNPILLCCVWNCKVFSYSVFLTKILECIGSKVTISVCSQCLDLQLGVIIHSCLVDLVKLAEF